MPFFSQVLRLIAIFQSTLFITIGHGVLLISLPLALQSQAIATSRISIVMAGYSLGLLIGGLLSHKIFSRLGYFRTFVVMLTLMLVCVGLHGISHAEAITFLLRFLFGIAIMIVFIMLESWLNSLSDPLNRGKIFSIYQIFYGIGFALSPLLYELGSRFDYSVYFGVIIVFLLGMLPLSFSRLATPELPERVERKSILSVFTLSPEIFTTVLFAGIIFTATISLTAIYAMQRFPEGWLLGLILSSYAIGSLLMQFPVGWLADRYKKNLISLLLMLLGLLANIAILASHKISMAEPLILIAFLIAGGCAACMYPLSITHIYDYIDNKDSLAWIATVQMIYGIGSLIGPVILGVMMDAGGLVMFPLFLIGAHSIVALAVVLLKIRPRHDAEASPDYQLGVQQATLAIRPSGVIVSGDDIGLVADPGLKVLVAALKQQSARPKELLSIMLEDGLYNAGDLAVNIVYYCGEQAKELLDDLLTLAPDMRIHITRNLLERLVDEEGRLTLFIARALLHKADAEERQEIRNLIAAHQTAVREQLA